MLLDSQSEPAGATPAALPAYVRASGVIQARFAPTGRGTRVMALREAGGYRLKFPKAAACEAVLINTGGGMTGGDRLDVSLTLDADAQAVITTQSAEKIYRSDGAAAEIAVDIAIAEAGQLSWLPQEAILFSGSRLRRRLRVAMAASARLTLAETVVFGRVAAGETLGEGLFDDRWEIRRDGRLVFAEAVRLDGAIAATLARPALGGGARAVATVVHLAPDAERRIEEARAALDGAQSDCGASAWNGMLCVRLAAEAPAVLRADMAAFLSRFQSGPLPRVWQC
ncbi:urease accessory protein UreD [Alsobacter metallidurans]|uniref:Urease accessory protein UreD n=1 Tax=Alsobacter metallidurans TaxID=340221 RepID=A0A917MFU3_9HYPH|nr:urease accessory protein UreD [Alsobacter metallidurans]GGH06531.1 urease accessory protein UreD [Alsobacter metallidurans]